MRISHTVHSSTVQMLCCFSHVNYTH